MAMSKICIRVFQDSRTSNNRITMSSFEVYKCSPKVDSCHQSISVFTKILREKHITCHSIFWYSINIIIIYASVYNNKIEDEFNYRSQYCIFCSP